MSKTVSFLTYKGNGSTLAAKMNANASAIIFAQLSQPYYYAFVEGSWTSSALARPDYQLVSKYAIYANGLLYNIASANDFKALQAQIDDMDLAKVGADGKYIKFVEQENGVVTAEAADFDTVITDDTESVSAPTSKAVATYVKEKTASISGAMHFRAVVATSAEEGHDLLTLIKAYYTTAGTTPKAGDVFIDSTSHKEYVINKDVATAAALALTDIEEFGSVDPKTVVTSFGGKTGDITLEASASKVQLAISASGEVSADVVAGSIEKTDLDSSVQASLDLADSAVQEVAEGSTNGTIAVDGTDVPVHGLGSAAYEDTDAFQAAFEDGSVAASEDKYITGISQTAGSIAKSSEANVDSAHIVDYAEAETADEIAATDTIAEAFGKTQKQINDMDATFTAAIAAFATWTEVGDE